MTELTITLDPAAQALLRRLETFPGPAIAAAMDRENELSIGHIQSERMSRRGPETLGVVSNRLRSSLRRTVAVIETNSVASSIGSNVKYMGVHEFGYQGTVQVSPFLRRNPRGNITTLTRRGATKLIASGVSHVRAHSRTMKMPERAPIRRGLADRSTAYGRAISDAIIEHYSGK